MMKWDDGIAQAVINKTPAFLHGAGQIMVNQIAEEAPILTGALKNSFTYATKEFQSEFGNASGAKLEKGQSSIPPADAKISKPNEDNIVKVGSALVYAHKREREGKGAGYASRAFDIVVSSGQLVQLAKKVFGL